MTGFTGRQLTLDPDPIHEAWRRFHRAHPEVMVELIRLAREWKTAGHAHGSISLFSEVVRWSAGLRDVSGDDGFKINNNYRALYARQIMTDCPDLDGFFNLRERRAA